LNFKINEYPISNTEFPMMKGRPHPNPLLQGEGTRIA